MIFFYLKVIKFKRNVASCTKIHCMRKPYRLAVALLLYLALLESANSNVLLYPTLFGLGHGIVMGISHIVIAKKVPRMIRVESVINTNKVMLCNPSSPCISTPDARCLSTKAMQVE